MEQLTVLVIDDDRLIAEDIAASLKALGHHVCGIANSISEAAAFLRVGRPDLITLDVNLGAGREGLGIATVLRASDSIPIVFITGAPGQIEQDGAPPLDRSAVVAKPFSTEGLAEAIERATAQDQ